MTLQILNIFIDQLSLKKYRVCVGEASRVELCSTLFLRQVQQNQTSKENGVSSKIVRKYSQEKSYGRSLDTPARFPLIHDHCVRHGLETISGRDIVQLKCLGIFTLGHKPKPKEINNIFSRELSKRRRNVK